MKTVAVFGAGIAGLTAAHELVRRGFKVAVYETNHDAGGFFRSARRPEDRGMPSEYSWHGLGPWYHNAFAVMREIPYDAKGSVYDRCLARPMRFGVASNSIDESFQPADVFAKTKMFRASWLDLVFGGWLMLQTWTANRRSREEYAGMNAAAAWASRANEIAAKTWRATFGPWIGSDWPRVSLHHVGKFFARNMLPGPRHAHPADDAGGPWTHGPRDGWLLLRGPSSEAWFDAWVRDLEARGVTFFWEHTLERLFVDRNRVTSARVSSAGARLDVRPDHVVMATSPFAAREVFERSDLLDLRWEHALLTADGPHAQVSFRVAFKDRISWPGPMQAFVLADSEFNITLFAQEQAWHAGENLGENVGSLWTGTACVSSVAGRVHGLPVDRCTKEQFVEEVLAQIRGCYALSATLRAANGGRGITDFDIERVEVWHEWTFSPEGLVGRQPKWVNSTTNTKHQPEQRTELSNLVLAGAHTRTSADLWSIEAAVESGRLAARILEPSVPVIRQHRAWWLRVLHALDDGLYVVGAPHVLTVTLVAAMLGLFLLALRLRR